MCEVQQEQLSDDEKVKFYATLARFEIVRKVQQDMEDELYAGSDDTRLYPLVARLDFDDAAQSDDIALASDPEPRSGNSDLAPITLASPEPSLSFTSFDFERTRQFLEIEEKVLHDDVIGNNTSCYCANVLSELVTVIGTTVESIACEGTDNASLARKRKFQDI